jgi:hypothetical protein
MSDPVTMFVLARRPAELSRDEFRDRWRQLAEFATTLPVWQHVRRYSQCEPIDVETAGWRGSALDGLLAKGYGGIAILEFEDADAWSSFMRDPGYAKLAAEHRAVFGEATDEAYAAAGEYLVAETRVPRIVGDGPWTIKNIAFFRRQSHLSREAFLSTWQAFSTANFVANDEITRNLISYNQYLAPLSGEFAARGFDGAAEVTLADDAAASRWIAAQSRPESDIVGRQNFFDPVDSRLFMVTETVLHDSTREAAPATA